MEVKTLQYADEIILLIENGDSINMYRQNNMFSNDMEQKIVIIGLRKYKFRMYITGIDLKV